MQVKVTFVGTLNGIHGIWCGFRPEGAKIKEARPILYPEEGYLLEKDGETYSSVWLKDGDEEENYTEVKISETDQA